MLALIERDSREVLYFSPGECSNFSMKKMRWIVVAGAVILMSSCGTEPKTLGKRNDTEKDKKNSQVTDCSKELAPSFHEVAIQLSSPPPAKMAISLEGIRKYSECVSTPNEVPPITRLRRENNQVILRVEHYGAYGQIPRDVNFVLYTIPSDCSAGEEVFYEGVSVPLSFALEYPNGKQCAGRLVAKQKIIKQ